MTTPTTPGPEQSPGTAPRTLLLPPAPRLERPEGGLLNAVVPLLGTLATVVVMAGAAGVVDSAGLGRRQLLIGTLFVAAAVAFLLVQTDRQRQQRRRAVLGPRRDHLRALAAARAELRAAGEEQRATMLRRFPAPPAPAEAGNGEDFLVRHGTASATADLVAVAPLPGADADPVGVVATTRLAAAHATLPDLPATLDLGEVAVLAVPDPAIARAIVCSAVARHGPTRLGLAIRASPPRRPAWEWVKWLPHTQVPAGAAHLLLVTDGLPPPPATEGVTALVVDPTAVAASRDGQPLPSVPDRCSAPAAEALARRLARRAAGARTPFRLDPDWGATTDAERLTVVLGTGDDGAPVHLDLKEAAAGGIGPHGLVVGATGSGKSELLRSVVVQLALRHPPDELTMVLIDFKGGAAFAGLAELPHLAGLVTNLADDAVAVDRMSDALAGEVLRRQEVVRAAGATVATPGLGLPTLLVVVDEFAELVAARPELLEQFVAIARLGRSLGIHLVLATQRLDEGGMRPLEAHLAYRIALRTFSAGESLAALGVPDAALLPRRPGLGFLRPDPATLVRFAAPDLSAPRARPVHGSRPVPFTATSGPAAESGPSVVAEAAERIRRRGAPRARQVWLPPLGRHVTLGRLLASYGGTGLCVPVGLVDRPREQRRLPLSVDVAAGPVAIVGAPRSGRTTLVTTLLSALALRRSPSELRLYLLDPGRALGALSGVPHVRVSATDPDLLRRAVAELSDLEAERTRTGERVPDVVVAVDGWGVLRQHHDDLLPDLNSLAERGPGLGIHLVVATNRWADLRGGARDAVATRLELRLADPLDSEVDRRQAALVPAGCPGRGIAGMGQFLAALPQLGDGPRPEPADGTELAAQVRRRWPGQQVDQLRPLPREVPLGDLPPAAGLRFGLLESGLPATLTPGDHLVVLGDAGSGRTSLLRSLAHELASGPPDRAQALVLDPRGSLAGVLPASHRLGHLTNAAEAARTLAALAERLTGRLAGQLARQLAGPPVGPAVVVLVDDHELLAGAAGDPLQPLLSLLPRSREIGLSLVLARRAGGAGRALYEPTLLQLRELGATGVQLSISGEDGPLLGGLRPVSAPPGRGRLIRPGARAEALQAAWTAPPPVPSAGTEP